MKTEGHITFCIETSVYGMTRLSMASRFVTRLSHTFLPSGSFNSTCLKEREKKVEKGRELTREKIKSSFFEMLLVLLLVVGWSLEEAAI